MTPLRVNEEEKGGMGGEGRATERLQFQAATYAQNGVSSSF